MPELPEVETTVRLLRELILQKTIERIVVLEKGVKLLGDVTPEVFSAGLAGHTFQTVERQGKYIILSTSNAAFPILIVHLRMTGRFLFVDHGHENKTKNRNPTSLQIPPNLNWERTTSKLTLSDNNSTPYPDRHTRVIFHFADSILYFSDLRRFATVHLLDNNDVRNYKGIKTLGIDALANDMNSESFWTILQKSSKTNRNIYQLLLDQTKIAGVGNIYANEALFIAKIRPTRPVKLISRPESDNLYTAIRSILEKAVEAQGTSLSDYKTPTGSDGQYQLQLKVYGQKEITHKGKKYPVKRVKMGGRSIWFVPELQK